jgi:hypothetical protein
VEGRDAVWAHPDLMPTAEDLDDPEGFVAGRPELDFSELDVDSLTEDPADPDPGDEGEAGPQTEGPGDPDGPKES